MLSFEVRYQLRLPWLVEVYGAKEDGGRGSVMIKNGISNFGEFGLREGGEGMRLMHIEKNMKANVRFSLYQEIFSSKLDQVKNASHS